MRDKILFTLIVTVLLTSSSLAQTKLTLDNFIKAAIKNNPSYQVSAQDYLIALEANKSVQALEDWNIITSGFIQDANPAQVSSFSPSYQKTMGYSIGTEKYLAKTGTAVKLEHSNTRVRGDYSAMTIPGLGTLDFNPPSTYYLSNLSLTISQPLLKNAFGVATRNSLKLSGYTVDLAKIKLAEDWEEFIATLKKEYLVWQKQKQALNIFKDKVKAVKNQQALVQKQLRYGLSENLDLVQIKQKVAGYEIMLEQAQMAYESQTNKIILMMGEKDYKKAYTPQKFMENGPVLTETQALTYLEKNSNVKQTADVLVAMQKTGLEIKQDSEKMDLNLVLQTKPNAFANSASESISQIGENNEYTMTVAASKKLGNNGAQAETKKAAAEYNKAVKQKESILLNAKIGLSSLYTSLKRLDKIITLNESNLKLAKKRLSLERKKYRQGRSSIFFLMQAEDDMLQAENNLNSVLFTREEIVNQIKAFTDRYLVEYKDTLKL